MSDLSYGLGQGFMFLADFLNKRMAADWEDKAWTKRQEAMQKAEIEKMKALEAYKATQPAGSVPFLSGAEQGPPQPMMQDVNARGTAIAGPRAMQPHERFAFDQNTNQARAEAQALALKEQMAMEDRDLKQRTAEARIKKDEAATRKYDRPSVAKPTKEPSKAKVKQAATRDISQLISKLPPEVAAKVKMRWQSEEDAYDSGAVDSEDFIQGISKILMEFAPSKE